jgi:VIT family
MRRRFLEPIDRVSEALFGLIMVLTFTGSLSAAEAGHADVRAMLIGALGCNLAWGVIDGVFYLMGCLAEQGREHTARRALNSAAADPTAARRALADALPSFVASVARPEELDAIGERVRERAGPVSGPRLGRDEWLGALSVFLWVFLTTFPVVVPFLFVSEPVRALRVSNAVALALLYLSGHALGRITGYRPWITGLVMVAVGAVLVALTIALGG